MRILTFADMGIGNLIWYLPVLRALSQHDLTVICPNQELRDLINAQIKCSFQMSGKYDVSVNNFLCQRKEDIKKIWRIKKRIGHSWVERKKFVWLFTDKIPMDKDKGEEYYNNLLLQPLGLEPIYEKIKFPDFNVKEYDVIISKNSSTVKKDWEHWHWLIEALEYRGLSVKVLDQKEQPLIVAAAMISKCKLFIGNDSGMAKISANLGIPTIQIFRWFTDCFVRARVNGVNLIEPTLQEVLNEIHL